MALPSGTRVGPYEVVSPLGAGGMGEVYRARDSKLQREVAIKVLPEHLATDRERMARFEREAQVLASLNHPHIGHIYGFEQSGDIHALVLELVEGETLAERISSGPLPLDEALPIARQIAQALEAAHEQGIVHRDLKPANSKITPAGVVKVLDFGLAKLADSPVGSASGSSHSISPTLTSPAMTGVGTILGTAAYMSPEQAKGRPADKRSDMWAFGAVLYEMLTGTRAFDGEDVSDTMAAVLRGEPEWSKLPPAVSPALRTLIRRCLEKDRTQRVADAAAALFVLRELATLAPAAAGPALAPPRRGTRSVVFAAGAVILAAALAAAATWFAMRPEAPRIVRFDITPPPEALLTVGPAGVNLVISPRGDRIVYHARHGATTALEMRSLDTGEAGPLPQTDGATSPAFSPDGSHLAFVKAGKVYKLTIDSRVLTALANISDATAISWGVADSIMFTRPGPKGGLFRIAAGGGTPELVAAPDPKAGEQDYVNPAVLPDGSTVVFVVRSASGGNSRLTIAARSLASGQQKVLVEGAVQPAYADGYLLYVQGGVLTGSRFDADRLALVGPAVPLVNGIVSKGSSANVGVSSNGTLTYIPGSTINYVSRFIWRARDGRLLGAAGPDKLEYPRYPRISPDGHKLVATIGPAQEGHIWVYDITGAAQPYKITFNAHNTQPTWSPDSSRVAFVSTRDGPTRNLFVVPADGSIAEPSHLVKNDKDKTVVTWSRDGWLVYQQLGDTTRTDLWKQPAREDGKSELWVQTPFAETSPTFSQDGKWLAYVTDTTTADEVWIRPFPGPGSPVRVSVAGGHDPVWSRDGQELFYQEGSKLMAAAVASTSPLQMKAPKMLFDGGFVTWEPNTPRTYDVAADGRFLMIEPSTTNAQRFNVVLNWTEELKRLVPK
jgi:Tol biopolymer transport system component/tRNA A-37 threonylcarbamoyl transferase component Bud32